MGVTVRVGAFVRTRVGMGARAVQVGARVGVRVMVGEGACVLSSSGVLVGGGA